jgi:hypothetical protein
MKAKLLIVAALDLFAFHAQALAGGDKAGNGGFVIQCEGQPLVVLDYYEASLSGPGGEAQLLSLASAELAADKTVIMSRLNALEQFDTAILKNFIEVEKVDNWIFADLDIQQDDTNMPYQGCQKPVRAAYRQSDTVYVQKSVVSQLSPGQIYVLSLHEWLYAASKLPTSDKVRHVMRELLKAPKLFSQVRLQEAVTDLFSQWKIVNAPDVVVQPMQTMQYAELLNKSCQSVGSEFVTNWSGWYSVAPNCMGYCQTTHYEQISCAKLVQ